MKKLALFDLDHTLIPTDSDAEWARYMVANNMVDAASYAPISMKFYEDYQNGCLDVYAYLNFSLKALINQDRSFLNQHRTQFLKQYIQPKILPAAQNLVNSHLDKGDLCCIITATNAFITRPIAQLFNIDHLIAIELETENNDPEGRYTGAIRGIPSFQAGKIIRAQQWLASLQKSWDDFAETYFYSDSRNDIPLLEKMTHPVATNPDPVLTQYATERGWRILKLFP